MKHLLIILLYLLSFVASAQKFNHTVVEPEKNQLIILGYCNKAGFKLIPAFDSAYHAEYGLYPADPAIAQQIQQQLKGIKITIVMGSWCGDSREWVPRFYRIMDKTGFNFRKNLTVISVDRDRKAPGTKADVLNVVRVPTFIFYNKRKELGRIVETPMDVFEREILRIISIAS